jgi:hypothetical protein
MDGPADRRLFGMCLLAAVAAFLLWVVALQETGGVTMLVIAVVLFAVLMFVDGYRSVS